MASKSKARTKAKSSAPAAAAQATASAGSGDITLKPKEYARLQKQTDALQQTVSSLGKPKTMTAGAGVSFD